MAPRSLHPGVPQIIDAHHPDQPDGRSIHQPWLRSRSEAEIAFVGIGPGAGRWFKEAGPAGATRIRAKMARAVELGLKKQHRQEIQALRDALEQAHCENLGLRRELNRRGLPGQVQPR
ncbi:hypothetical protein ACFZB2_35275 [Streptomyces bobili]|uniref:hypothetical protein n=1 Tax=Streptomyces bobili TaxID=67280 RepID=UPI0036E1B122